MQTRRRRTGTGLLAPWGPAAVLTLVVMLSGCGGTGTGIGTDEAARGGPSTAATTEDGMAPQTDETDGPTTDGPTPDGPTPDGPTPEGSTTGPTAPGSEPDLLLPPATPSAGAAELPVDPRGAELTLVVGGPDGAQPPVTLSCDWAAGVATGSHPQPEQACADLRAAVGGANPFTPVAPDAICTQQYGGDATAEVSGAVLDAEGGPVDVAATFSLTDGCQISRWQRLGAVLAPYRGTT